MKKKKGETRKGKGKRKGKDNIFRRNHKSDPPFNFFIYCVGLKGL